ncbi:N-acetylglucosamine kinase [Brevibacterium renqingii]|uniref:N-acetylglucosamine kinase n=1 Tax=Brevibacterium renqingii TaxID=2776916 RepID=UPI001ADFB010|nr:BadF/BadG/BcrA/BcrD ATPase family protein [Brevibacterium renqingii]
MSRFVLGIDIGGTGSRAALGVIDADGGLSGAGRNDGGPAPIVTPLTGPRVVDTFTGPRIEVGAGGSTVLAVARELVDSAVRTWSRQLPDIVGIGIGATGIASLSESPADALTEISAELGMPAVAAIDAVTAHLGALGGSGGAVTVLGTGAIAIAHLGPDERGRWAADWLRVDGWGHLFGDRGGGAWLGRLGLETALRTHDGLDEHGRTLLEAATRRFGPPASWPGRFYTRNDRAGLLAEFAADIAACARAGDIASAELLDGAGREAARSAVAAGRAASPRIALTGGVAAAGGCVVDGFRTEASRLQPGVSVVDPAGGPLDGALTLAHLGAGGKLSAQDKVIWS